MKLWIEQEKDVFNYFQYFNDEKEDIDDKYIPNMSVFSVNGSRIWGIQDKNRFIARGTKEVIKFFKENHILNKHKIYLFVNLRINNINSVVENYMKVWKRLKKNKDIEGFILGPELMHQTNQASYFSSIAEIPVQYLSKAIDIVSLNPDKYTIFLSSEEKVLSEKFNEQLFELAFNRRKTILDPYDQLNYFLLSLMLCTKGDILMRYGTASDEDEVAIIYNSDEFNINWINIDSKKLLKENIDLYEEE